MKLKPQITLIDHFSKLTDPRIDRTKEHKLIDILTIAICGMICGANNWVAMEQYGNSKQEWLKQFLELPNGIPSHDTIARVFARIDPLEFEQCFRGWVKTVSQLIQDKGADYCLALKGNHKHLHEKVIQLFTLAQAQDWSGIEHSFHRTISKGHGRTEIRRYWAIATLESRPSLTINGRDSKALV
jgi:predicted transposase YbfD/YdcC